MADTVIYEFDAYAEGVEEWSTNPGEMVDGVETDYASTSTDGDIQKLTENECVGTDLGTISKVEIRAYAYGDVDDQLILRPVFGGTADGDNHTEAPGTVAGWKTWWDITSDANSPTAPEIEQKSSNTAEYCFSINWVAQTFTTGDAFDITNVELHLGLEGNPGTLTVSIKAVDENGHPTGEDLTVGTIEQGDVEAGEYNRITLTSYSLSATTKYAIVARISGGDLSNRYLWNGHTSDVFANGNSEVSNDNGDTWNANTSPLDQRFKVNVGDWSWPDIQNLDCDVVLFDVSKGNIMYCGMVQIQVTYTAEAPPTGAAVQMMHYARMRRAG